MKRSLGVLLLLLFSSSSVLAADASERKFIRAGMSEGEVLLKIGKPDTESIDSGGGAAVTVKRWIHLPTPGDEQTLTTVVIANGKVTEVTRKISR
jgi:hypothetical protein